MGCCSSKSAVVTSAGSKAPVKRKSDVPGLTHDEIRNETVLSLTYVPADYPSPQPLVDQKDNYIRGINFTSIDNRAYQARDKLLDDYSSLINYLTNQQQIQNVMSMPDTKRYQLLKVRSIWSWLVHQYLNILRGEHGDGHRDTNAVPRNASIGRPIAIEGSIIRTSPDPALNQIQQDVEYYSNPPPSEIGPEQGRHNIIGTGEIGEDREQHVDTATIQGNGHQGSRKIRHDQRQQGTISVTSSMIQSNTRPRSNEIHNVTVPSPKGDLKLVASGKVDIAVLFAVCCRWFGSDIKCVVVEGQWKPDEYEVGGAVEEKCLWNAVYLNDQWRLIHPLWSVIRRIISASRFQDKIVIENSKRELEIDDYHFLTDPEEFITRCLPDDPQWQLLKIPVPEKKFKQMAHLTEDFYRLKLTLSDYKEGIRKTTKGRARIVIEFPPDRQPQLYYDMTEIPTEEDDSGATTLMDTDELKRHVFMYKKDDKYFFSIKCIKRGLYSFKIFGEREQTEDRKLNPLLVQLQIKCEEPDGEARPLPYCPAIGFGQSGFASKLGVVPVSHKSGMAYTNEQGRAKFMFKVAKGVELQAKLFSKEWKEMQLHTKGNKVTLVVVLQTQFKETMLQINARTGKNREFINVCNFVVRLQQLSPEKMRARDERLKRKLKECMKSENLQQLAEAIEDYVMLIHKDNGELKRAEDTLVYLRLKGRLEEALMRENASYLRGVIYDTETSKYAKILNENIKKARGLLQKLSERDAFEHHVLEINQSVLLELRGYTRSQPIIYNVTRAALLLLGESRGTLNDWKKVKVILARPGKDSILRRMENFDASEVDSERFVEVENLLSRHTLEEARRASAGLAAIYRWVKEALYKAKPRRSADVTQDPHLTKIPNEMSSFQQNRKRKRKASGNMTDDSDDEGLTTGEISPEILNSP